MKINDALRKIDVSPYNPIRNTGFVFARPNIAVIEITNYCNLKCKKCLTRDSLPRSKGFLSVSDMEIILSKLPETIEFIGLNGFGESLLHPEFGILLQTVRRTKKNTSLGFHTNGTLLTKEISEIIISNDVNDIEISLDTYNSSDYKQLQSTSVPLNNVINNIKSLINLRNESKSHLRIGLAYIIQQENIGQLSSFVCLAKDIGVDFVGPIKPINPLLGYKRNGWVTSYIDIANEIENAKKTANSLDINIQAPNIHSHKAGSANIEPLKGYSCSFPMTLYPIITWDGFVMPCVWLQDTKYSTGNIIHQNFNEIWNGKKIRNLRSNFAKEHYFDACQNCKPGFFEYAPMKLKTADEVYSR